MEEELGKAERNRLAALERKAVTSVANPNLQPFANKGNQVKIEIPLGFSKLHISDGSIQSLPQGLLSLGASLAQSLLQHLQ